MLVNCVVYRNGAKLADIPVADISDYMARPVASSGSRCTMQRTKELSEMQEEFGLHELAVEDARHGHQRPKIEEYGNSLFVVLQLLEPAADSPTDLNVGEVNVFVGPNYVLSVRNRSKLGFLGVRERCEREPELLRMGSGFVLYALMDAVVDRYFPIIDALEVELEAIEHQIFTKGAARDSIKQLYELKQRVMVLKHAVAPLREAAGKLHGGRVPQVCIGVAGILPRRGRSPEPNRSLDRLDARHHRHRHPRQPVDGDHRGSRGDQAPGGLGQPSSRCAPPSPASGA